MAENNIIISINTKMTIKMFARNNRIIIKESFAFFLFLFCFLVIFPSFLPTGTHTFMFPACPPISLFFELF